MYEDETLKHIEDELKETKLRTIIPYPLAHRVLAVAVITEVITEFDEQLIEWAVYIDAVKGHDHQAEKYRVAKYGDKQSRCIAQLLFPHLNINKYRR